VSALAVTIVLYGLGLAGVLAWLVATGASRGVRTGAALGLVQVATTGLAVADGVTTLPDLHGYAAATHTGYLLTSVVVLPVTYTLAGQGRGRWGNAAMSFGCVLLAVVVVRLRQTDGG
jgi:hypothetical protein